MIKAFSSKLAQDIYDGTQSRFARKPPKNLHGKAQRLLDQLNAATKIETMRIPPSNKLKRPPTHPGEMLSEEFLKPKKISQKQFAAHLGWTYARLNEIVNGRRGVSASSALAFADAFRMEAEFWLNLQRDWDLWIANQKHKKINPLEEAA